MRIPNILLILTIALFAERSLAADLSEEQLRALGITATAARPPSIVPNENQSWSWTYGPFRYDGSGNIAAIDDQAYLYDAQNRLIQAGLTRPDQPGVQTEAYTYDAFGNMTARTRNGVGPAIPTNSATNRLNGSWVLYDEGGNLTRWQADDGHIYVAQYDALHRLQSINLHNEPVESRHVFLYTADGERIWSWDTVHNVSHWSLRGLDDKVLRTFVNAGDTWSLDRDYVYRDGLLLAAVKPSGALHFSLDHLGTPRVITDDDRIRVGFHHYFPFGDEWSINDGAQEGERMKFTGHERDADIAGGANGLDYMHARYYRAGVGRFLSVDPTWESADLGTPESWNRYSYVRNNPISNTDPDGKICIPCAAVGALVAVSYESYRQVKSGEPVNNARLLAAVGIGAAAGAGVGAAAPIVLNLVLANPAAVATGTTLVAGALTPGGESITGAEIAAINRSFGGTTEMLGHVDTVIANMMYRETAVEKAAGAIRDIAVSHLFDNGNKRTAQAVAEKLLKNSGITAKRIRAAIDTAVKNSLKDVDDIVKLLK